MRRTVFAVVIVLLGMLFIGNPIFAQVSIDKFILDGKKKLAEATNNWDEEALIKARSVFERILMQKEDSYLAHYYIGLADYRLASIYFSTKGAKAEQYIDDGINHLEKAVKINKRFADGHALLSTLYGQKINLDPSMGMTLGQQTWVYMENAGKLEPKNPRVLMLQAMSTYFSPEEYGGSRTKGMTQMEKSINAFREEEIDDPLLPDWGFEDALTMMATWKIENGKTEEALNYVNETLKINPDYGWAIMMKDSLTTDKKQQ